MTRRWIAIAILSLAANVVLLVLLIARPQHSASSTSVDPCERARSDIDFFIEGLDREQDTYYSPLVVRSLAPLVEACQPSRRDEVEALFAALRKQLAELFKQDAPPAQREALRREARALFVDARELTK